MDARFGAIAVPMDQVRQKTDLDSTGAAGQAKLRAASRRSDEGTFEVQFEGRIVRTAGALSWT